MVLVYQFCIVVILTFKEKEILRTFVFYVFQLFLKWLYSGGGGLRPPSLVVSWSWRSLPAVSWMAAGPPLCSCAGSVRSPPVINSCCHARSRPAAGEGQQLEGEAAGQEAVDGVGVKEEDVV